MSEWNCWCADSCRGTIEKKPSMQLNRLRQRPVPCGVARSGLRVAIAGHAKAGGQVAPLPDHQGDSLFLINLHALSSPTNVTTLMIGHEYRTVIDHANAHGIVPDGTLSTPWHPVLHHECQLVHSVRFERCPNPTASRCYTQIPQPPVLLAAMAAWHRRQRERTGLAQPSAHRRLLSCNPNIMDMP